WVVHHSMDVLNTRAAGESRSGVICFTPGTVIATPQGPRKIEDLREGDCVQTRDNGAQPVQWIGSRRMTGARLFAMPKLRPIRIRAGALGIDRPDQELVVSPDHRMLVRGAAAQALFNSDEVLVAARDLVNGSTVAVDHALREVTYVHLLLPGHEILWANGVESESFHPASA
ncbi:MAG: Hint domain-containing protein, partial [Shimia sp.]|nr:Hint domain-containing protein [Shimia sp.]